MRDDSRFEDLVRRHHAAVWRAAWGVLRDETRALDAVQTVYLELVKDPEALASVDEGRLRFRAIQRALNILRQESRLVRREREHAMERATRETEEPAGRAAGRELHARLRAATTALPTELRTPLVLRFQEELSFRRIGELLGVAEATAHDRVRKGLEKLRASLKAGGLVLSTGALERSLAASAAPPVPAALGESLLGLAPTGAGLAAGSGALTSLKLWVGGAAVGVAALVAGSFALRDTPEEAKARDAAPVAARAATEAEKAHRARSFAFLDTSSFTPGPEGAARKEATGGTAATRGDGPSAPIHGRVRTPDHQPLGGIPVRLIAHVPGTKPSEGLGTMRTDAEGAFAFAPPEEGWPREELLLRLDPRYHTGETRRRILAPSGETQRLQDFVLEEDSNAPVGPFTLELRVRDARGQPLDDVPVRLLRPRGDVAAPEKWVEEDRGRTQVGGTVRLEGERLGPKRLALEPPGGTAFAPTAIGHEVARPGFAVVEAVLPDGLQVTGRLVNRAAVRPARLGVTLRPHGAGPRRGAFIDEGGRFAYEGLPAEPFDLLVRVGDAPHRLVRTLTPPAKDLVIDLAAPPFTESAPGIHGRCLEAGTGEPVFVTALDRRLLGAKGLDSARLEEDFALAQLTQPFLGQMELERAQTFGRDRFHVESPRPGRYVLEVRIHGYVPAYLGPFDFPEDDPVTDLAVALERGARLEGRILDAAGRPVAAAAVFPVGRGPASRSLIARRREQLPEPGADTRMLKACGVAITDAEGRFSLARLPSRSDVQLAIVAHDHAPHVVPAPALRDGARHDLDTLRLPD